MLDPKVGRKPEAYASQLGCKLDLSLVEVQGRVVLKVVTVKEV